MLNNAGTTVTWSSLVSGVAPQKQVDLQSELEAWKLPMPVTSVDWYKCCSFCYAAPANLSTMTCTAHTRTADCVNITITTSRPVSSTPVAYHVSLFHSSKPRTLYAVIAILRGILNCLSLDDHNRFLSQKWRCTPHHHKNTASSHLCHISYCTRASCHNSECISTLGKFVCTSLVMFVVNTQISIDVATLSCCKQQ